MKPTFILAGSFPSGTGQLFALLEQHPEVYLPLPMAPECNFFFKTREYERGLDHYEQRWFSGWSGQKAIGERSSLLLSGLWVPERLSRHLPSIKLIFLLRDPVDRAYANYRFTALAGLEELDFETALREEDRRCAAISDPFWSEIQPHAYFRRGLYDEQLREFLKWFPSEQFLVMRSDRLLENQPLALRDVFGFLGVDQEFEPDPVPEFSSPAVVDLERQRELRETWKSEFDAAIQHLRLANPPRTELEQQITINLYSGYEPLPQSQRRALASRYRASNLRLRELVSFDIGDWL